MDLDQSWIYATPNLMHTSVCVHVVVTLVRGGGWLDCAGLHTMCVPQGVVRGRLESAQRVLLPCISVSPPPPLVRLK